MKKKIFATLLIAVLMLSVFSFAACGDVGAFFDDIFKKDTDNDKDNDNDNDNDNPSGGIGPLVLRTKEVTVTSEPAVGRAINLLATDFYRAPVKSEIFEARPQLGIRSFVGVFQVLNVDKGIVIARCVSLTETTAIHMQIGNPFFAIGDFEVGETFNTMSYLYETELAVGDYIMVTMTYAGLYDKYFLATFRIVELTYASNGYGDEWFNVKAEFVSQVETAPQ